MEDNAGLKGHVLPFRYAEVFLGLHLTEEL